MSGTVNGHCTLRLKAMENESPTTKFLFNRCIFFILVQCTLLFFFHLFFKSIKGNCFIYNVKFTGLNFPPNGPVMQKKTQGWEPNTERLYARDGMLIGNNFIACSRLRNSGEKSFRKKGCEKRAGAGPPLPFPSRARLIFALLVLIRSHYTI